MPTFTTPGPITAIVQLAGARVRATASDRTDTFVLVEPIDETSRSDVNVAAKTKVEFADGQLSVKTTASGNEDGSVAITIDLPTHSSLFAYLAHTDVQADGSFGECELHMAKGRVHLDRTTALRANIADGVVEIGRVTGPAEVEGSVVDVRIRQVEGRVGLSSSGGRIWIGHASSDLDLDSGSGSFEIDRADGSVTATTGDGAIRIGRMSHGQAKLTNGSGNIEVGVSDGVVASVDVDSERGAVHDLVSAEGNPDRSEHEVRVHARTRNGDVIVRRAAR